MLSSLAAGAVAGVAVDVSLFPIDTIKTRMQSKRGFWATGGFRGVYQGLGAAALGSAPGAALFFVSYDTTKTLLRDTPLEGSKGHVVAAIAGEMAACLVRAPTENTKQSMQVGKFASLGEAMRGLIRNDGPLALWNGYGSMIIREIPFAIIQFPMYERIKQVFADRSGTAAATPLEGAVSGATAGAIAAALTTPLDVVKTRIMLREVDAKGRRYVTIPGSLESIWRDEGMAGLYSGWRPRTTMIGLGGFIFFGAYEAVKSATAIR